ncbi:MAG: YdcF family protein [Clostridia bacterium]|nr:YdcF family protein [Clostridia bacterium]
MAQFALVFLALASFFYYGLCAVLVSPRSSVLYFWPLLGAYFLLCAFFPLVRPLLLLPLLIFLFLFLLFCAFSLLEKRAPFHPPDVILVLGVRSDSTVPDRVFRGRVDLAKKALLRYPEAVCILSGGRVFGETDSEARLLYKALEKEGFGKKCFLLEEKSRTTKENFLLSFPLFPKGCSHALILTSRYHCFRASVTAHSTLPPCSLSFQGASAPIYFLPHLYLREFITFSVDLLQGNVSIHQLFRRFL